MYDLKNRNNINDVIKSMFKEKLKLPFSSNPLDNTKSVDPTKLPPCKRILEQYSKRIWFIACLYKTTATAYTAADHIPVKSGWQLRENKENLEIKYFLPAVP